MQGMSDATVEAVKIAPPVGVVALTLAGMPLDEFIAWLTISYLIFLHLEKLWPWMWRSIIWMRAWSKSRKE